MKKLFTILALVLTVALCASFAVSAETLTETLTALGTTATQDVSLRYDPVDEATVYSVDVVWEGLEFSYDAGDKSWNAADHSYTTTTEADWVNSDATVTVTNHSNAAVAVNVTYAPVAGAAVDVTITGANDGSNGLVKTFELDAGVEGAASSADKEVVTIAADESDVPTAAATKLGTVTVTVTAAN